MSSDNVHRIEEISTTPAPVDPLIAAAASVGAAPVSAAHPGDMSGTFNPDPPFWDMIGKRGEQEGWRDRTL